MQNKKHKKCPNCGHVLDEFGIDHQSCEECDWESPAEIYPIAEEVDQTTYIFNEHDVCMNSSCVFKIDSKKFRVELLFAVYKNKYYAAYHYSIGDGGGGSLPSYGEYRKGYWSKKQALKEQADYLMKTVDYKLKDTPNIKTEAKKFKDWYKEYFDL